MQWRDVSGRFSEDTILSKTQTDGWIPGLPYADGVPYPSTKNYLREGASGSRRDRELTALDTNSWGYPLTQCKSTTEYLKVAYDAILGMILNFCLNLRVTYPDIY